MADKNKVKGKKADRRRKRVRGKVAGTAVRPRLTVARSLRNISVQAIDDENRTTVVGITSNSTVMKDELKKKDDKNAVAKKVGMKVAELLKEKGIESVVFDRNQFLYHGRIKAVAEGAREGGLKL